MSFSIFFFLERFSIISEYIFPIECYWIFFLRFRDSVWDINLHLHRHSAVVIGKSLHSYISYWKALHRGIVTENYFQWAMFIRARLTDHYSWVVSSILTDGPQISRLNNSTGVDRLWNHATRNQLGVFFFRRLLHVNI